MPLMMEKTHRANVQAPEPTSPLGQKGLRGLEEIN